MTLPTSPSSEALVASRQGHLLQSDAWGRLKSYFGWTPVSVQAADSVALILFKRLPLGFTIGYIPKGPGVDWHNRNQVQAILSAIHAETDRRRPIFLKIEPDVPDPVANGDDEISQQLLRAGFNQADAIQPRSSIVIDISGSEADILAAMKQKTRYNIRLAKRKGVVIRQGGPVDVYLFHRLSLQTAHRDDFSVHSLPYYQRAFSLFSPDRCALLLAEYEDELLAGLMVFKEGDQAYYFYGASSNQHRNLMPTYGLQWEAIRWAKAQGCTSYDLWGIPDAPPETLEDEFTQRSDGLWGVYRFKRGFGGEVVRSIGAFDYVYNPLLYRLYRLRRGL